MKWWLCALVALTLVSRAFVMVVALGNPGRAFFENDTLVHDKLASNILNGNGFTLHDSPAADRSITRVPVYPALLAAVKKLSGSEYVRAMIILQNLLAVAAAAVLFVFLRRRYGPDAAGVAVFVMLASVPGIACANFLLTEIPYLFLSVTGLVLFISALDKRSVRYAIGAGAVASLAALCRPIHIFFPVLLAFAGFASSWRERRKASGTMLLFLAIYMLGMAPWMARNYVTYGRPELTHLNKLNVYLYKAGGTLSIVQNRDFEEVRADLIEMAKTRYGIDDIYENPRGEELVRYAIETIRAHPAAFLRSTATGCAGIALMPDKGKISWIMGREAPEFGLLWRQRKGSIGRTLERMNLMELALIMFQGGLLLFVYGTIAFGLLRGRYRFGDALVLASFLAVAYYFILPAGPESEPRFRIPATPYLGILVGCCLFAGRKGRSGP